jgi:S-adenosylmethionine/arginine decarboxylase-like enzyme
MSYWGYHVMMDCWNADRDSMQSRDCVERFIKELVNQIHMEPIGEPWIEYTAGHDPDKAGFTATQIIVTSSIVAHFVDSTGSIYLDVFSCKTFGIETVELVVKKFFNPEKIRVNFITRHAG